MSSTGGKVRMTEKKIQPTEYPYQIGDLVLLKKDDGKLPKYLDNTWAEVVGFTKRGSIVVKPEGQEQSRTIKPQYVGNIKLKTQSEIPTSQPDDDLTVKIIEKASFEKLTRKDLYQKEPPQELIQQPSQELVEKKLSGQEKNLVQKLFTGHSKEARLYNVIEYLKKIKCQKSDFVDSILKTFQLCGCENLSRRMVILKDYASDEIDYHLFINDKKSPNICLKVEKDAETKGLMVVNAWMA